MSLLYASTCFEHYVLIIRTSKLYYTASGIITPVGGLPVHNPCLVSSQILQFRPQPIVPHHVRNFNAMSFWGSFTLVPLCSSKFVTTQSWGEHIYRCFKTYVSDRHNGVCKILGSDWRVDTGYAAVWAIHDASKNRVTFILKGKQSLKED